MQQAPEVKPKSAVESEMELVQNEVKVQDNQTKPINTSKVDKTVVPDPSKEGKKVMWLFLKAMLAVGFCSILLYLILLFTKKFYSSAFTQNDAQELENLDLSTPNSRQESLRSFLNRTK